MCDNGNARQGWPESRGHSHEREASRVYFTSSAARRLVSELVRGVMHACCKGAQALVVRCSCRRC